MTIEELKNEIDYMERKMKCCACGKREILELEELKIKLQEMEDEEDD